MDLQGLQKIIKTGLFSLADSLASYWPAYGDAGISERNLTAHVANAFLTNGFDVFFEVPLSENAKGKRIDCLFLSYEHKLIVVCESKRLYGVEKAEGIINDIEKINNFELQDEEIEIESSYGLILADTWDGKIARWWISEEETGLEKKDQRWKKLSKIIEKAEFDSITLYHENEQDVHKALFALWHLSQK